jgi:hypothetical protein
MFIPEKQVYKENLYLLNFVLSLTEISLNDGNWWTDSKFLFLYK